MGRDWENRKTKAEAEGFNPRARMGRDRHRLCNHVDRFCFNPRARMGRDRILMSMMP